MIIEEPINAGTECVCGKWMVEEHACPFKSEIYQDNEPCKCCSYCEHQCAMDI